MASGPSDLPLNPAIGQWPILPRRRPLASEWIEFDEEKQRFRVKTEKEQLLFYHECYDEFRNESFQDELAVRLADRDLARAIGFQEWEKLSEEERRAHTTAWEKRYWEEFSKHGVERVVVVTPPGGRLRQAA